MALDAARSGTFMIGGELRINRLGFGAMRITGPGIWGPPQDKPEVLRTLRRLRALNVNFVDTADSYGPDVSEPLIREALHPYGEVVVATKAGLIRPGPAGKDFWPAMGRPDYLRQQVQMSLRWLGVEQISLWQLHFIDKAVPREDQFGAVKSFIDAGWIRFAGLSNVSVDDIEAARKVFKVATVQNLYNLVDRTSEDVVEYCAKHGIGFIPWYPLAAGALAQKGTVLDNIAQSRGVMPSQVALAWVLKRSPVMLPIPGTSRVSHLEENVAAADIQLTDQEFAALDESGKAEFRKAKAGN
jgi:pyridoxine 4-dehydrogenase